MGIIYFGEFQYFEIFIFDRTNDVNSRQNVTNISSSSPPPLSLIDTSTKRVLEKVTKSLPSNSLSLLAGNFVKITSRSSH